MRLQRILFNAEYQEMSTFMVYLINILCLFETEGLSVHGYFPKPGKSTCCRLKILLRKDNVWEAFTPLRECKPSISEVFLRMFVFFRLTIEAFYSKITTFWITLKIWNIAARKNTNYLVLFFTKYFGKLKIAILLSRNKIFYG